MQTAETVARVPMGDGPLPLTTRPEFFVIAWWERTGKSADASYDWWCSGSAYKTIGDAEAAVQRRQGEETYGTVLGDIIHIPPSLPLHSPDALEQLRNFRGLLKDYAIKHRKLGGFLTSCLENDFVQAAGRADWLSRQFLPEIAMYIFNYLPSGCWGSPEKVAAWLAVGEKVEQEQTELARKVVLGELSSEQAAKDSAEIERDNAGFIEGMP